MTRYHRKFVKGYRILARPVTDLFKKDCFSWENDVEMAFQKLKAAMCSTLVLALQNFDQAFIVEMDSCHEGIGAVLMQCRRPIAYMSKGINNEKLGMPICEKELLALIIVEGK